MQVKSKGELFEPQKQTSHFFNHRRIDVSFQHTKVGFPQMFSLGRHPGFYAAVAKPLQHWLVLL